MSFSPVIKNFKSKENTPVKGMDEVVKRMQKARGEKEWTKNMLERGVVIKVKDKENCKMVFDRLAEVEVSLPNGGTGKIAYCKGENLGGVVKDFCLKHNLPLAYHEKVMKKVVKSVKSREY